MQNLAVVIVNFRTPDLVSECLEAAAPSGPSEVVVVDNASGDGSAQALRERHSKATIVERSANDGFAAGVNSGFAATTAPVVAVLNPDVRMRSGALQALTEHLTEHPAAGIAAPRLVYPDGTLQPSAYRRFPGLATFFMELALPLGWVLQRLPALDPYRVPPSRWRRGERVAHVTGAALAIRRVAYDAAGPLDEGFFLYLEETEWQQRVRAAGFTVELVPDAEAVHLVRGGGEAALAPSPHFLVSLRRYLRLRGRPAAATEAVIAGGLGLSRLAARAEDLVLPPERRTGGARAAAYDALWRAGRV